jgi:hypothetical protein
MPIKIAAGAPQGQRHSGKVLPGLSEPLGDILLVQPSICAPVLFSRSVCHLSPSRSVPVAQGEVVNDFVELADASPGLLEVFTQQHEVLSVVLRQCMIALMAWHSSSIRSSSQAFSLHSEIQIFTSSAPASFSISRPKFLCTN